MANLGMETMFFRGYTADMSQVYHGEMAKPDFHKVKGGRLEARI